MKFYTLLFTLGILAGLAPASIHSMSLQNMRKLTRAKENLDTLKKQDVSNMSESEYQTWLKETTTHLNTMKSFDTNSFTRYSKSIDRKKRGRQRGRKTPTSTDIPRDIATKIHNVTFNITTLANALTAINKKIGTLQPHVILKNTVQALKPINTIHTEQQLLNLQKYKPSPIFKSLSAELKNAQDQLNKNRQMLPTHTGENYKAIAGSYDALIDFFNTVVHEFLT